MNIYTNDPHEFWSERPWPKDDNRRGFIFLARAMVDIGRAMFRDDWLGHEPYLSLTPRPLPPLLQLPKIPPPLALTPRAAPTEAKAEDAEAAPAGPWWAGGTLLAPSPKEVRTIERDQEAERILKEARSRWDQVMDVTLDALDRGELGSSWRSLYGGPYFDLPDTHWNIEDRNISWRRFVLCRMDPRLEFAFTGPLDGPGFIFLKGDNLTKLLGRLNGIGASTFKGDRLAAEGPSGEDGYDVTEPQLASDGSTDDHGELMGEDLTEVPSAKRKSSKRGTVIAAILSKWGKSIPEFPNNSSRDRAIYAEMRRINPDLDPRLDMPSPDTFDRAIKDLTSAK